MKHYGSSGKSLEIYRFMSSIPMLVMFMDVLASYVLAPAFFLNECGVGFVNVTGTGPSPCSVAMVTGSETRGI